MFELISDFQLYINSHYNIFVLLENVRTKENVDESLKKKERKKKEEKKASSPTSLRINT